jgi:uncharacterized membrane protein YtjA (UPF0391 family)
VAHPQKSISYSKGTIGGWRQCQAFHSVSAGAVDQVGDLALRAAKRCDVTTVPDSAIRNIEPLVLLHLSEVKPTMLHYSLAFLVIALIAAFLGFGGIAGVAADIAKLLFVIFLIVFAVSLLMGRRSILK